MGESKRRQTFKTLDGGPPSDEKILLDVEIFNPFNMDYSNKYQRMSRTEVTKRIFQRPTPVCGACDYEFQYAERPPLIFCIKPFIPRGNDYQLVVGIFCSDCAALSKDELFRKLHNQLRKSSPLIGDVVQSGVC
jgi:hypothetical protein